MKTLYKSVAIICAIAAAGCSGHDGTDTQAAADTVAVATIDTVAVEPVAVAPVDTIPAEPEKTQEEIEAEARNKQINSLLDDLEGRTDRVLALLEKVEKGDIPAVPRLSEADQRARITISRLDALREYFTPEQAERYASLVQRMPQH